MEIVKKFIINIYNTIRVFLTNLKRNFLREFLIGIGVIFGVTILIVATTIGDGFERLVKNSILGEIKYEQLKITSEDSDIYGNKITLQNIEELKRMEGIVEVLPITNIPFPISARVRIPTTTTMSIIEIIGNAIPAELANPYIMDTLKKDFPNGFHKTNGITPVLFTNFVLEAIENFFRAEGLPVIDLRELFKLGYRFEIRVNKSLFTFSSTNDIIKFPDGTELKSYKFDNFMNDLLNNINNKSNTYINTEALLYKPSQNIGGVYQTNNSLRLRDIYPQQPYIFNREILDINNININSIRYNPYEAYDYMSIINEPDERGDFVEQCMFVGFAPLHITYAISMPLEVIQAYKRVIRGADFREGYDSAFINVKDTTYLDSVMQELRIYNQKNNFKIDDQYEFFRGISEIVKNTVTALRGLVLGLGGLILLLTAMSIFYSFMYTISKREKEIGLYRFFGATRIKVITLLVLESAVIGFICAGLSYLFSYWLIVEFLPANFDHILANLPENILNMVFSTGSEFTQEITFSKIFRFDTTRSLIFMWTGVFCSAFASLIPAIKGSYTSLFKTINA